MGNRRDFLGGALAIAGVSYPFCANASSFGFGDSESIGAELDTGLRDAYQIVSDGELYASLRRIISKLAPAFGIPASSIDLCVLVDPLINALATGGRRMYLFAGMLDFCSSEHELAGVIAHELVHIKKDHLAQRIIETRATSVGETAATIAATIGLTAVGLHAYGRPAPFSPPTPNFTTPALQLSGASFETLGTLANVGFSKDNEFEADAEGTRALASTGYEATSLRDVLVRLDAHANEQKGGVSVAYGAKNDRSQWSVANTPALWETVSGKSSGALTGHYLNSANVSLSERIKKIDSELGK